MKHIFTLTFTAILILLQCVLNSYGQNNENKLLDQKLSIQANQVTLIYILATLAIDHKIPIGIEKSYNHKDDSKININVEKQSLREILNSITEQEPNYQWEITNNVINFTPTQNRGIFTKTLLDTYIKNFSPDKNLDKFEIRNNILQLPEVINLMNSQGIKKGRLTDYPYHHTHNMADLSVSNTNIRNLLNKIVRDSEYKIWIVELAGKNNEELIISF